MSKKTIRRMSNNSRKRNIKMKIILLSLFAAVILTGCAKQGNGTVIEDKDCKDFKTHSEAQSYFNLKSGSSSNNVDNLDADHDGIACESLP